MKRYKCTICGFVCSLTYRTKFPIKSTDLYAKNGDILSVGHIHNFKFSTIETLKAIKNEAKT